MPVYMTPACAEAMRAELRDLLYRKRPEMAKTAEWAAGNGDRSENADYQYAKRALRRFDSRIRFLTKRLEEAQVIDPVEQARMAAGRGLFGATVPVDEEGEEKTYSIVEIDETAPGQKGLLRPQMVQRIDGFLPKFRNLGGPTPRKYISRIIIPGNDEKINEGFKKVAIETLNP